MPRWSKVIWSLVAVVLAGGLTWAAWTYNGPKVIAGVLTVVMISAIVILWTSLRFKHSLVPATAVVVFGIVFAAFLPRLSDLALSQRLAEIVDYHGGGPVALSEYHEPSAVFLLGT